jgi:hypothetical protein
MRASAAGATHGRGKNAHSCVRLRTPYFRKFGVFPRASAFSAETVTAAMAPRRPYVAACQQIATRAATRETRPP